MKPEDLEIRILGLEEKVKQLDSSVQKLKKMIPHVGEKKAREILERVEELEDIIMVLDLVMKKFEEKSEAEFQKLRNELDKKLEELLKNLPEEDVKQLKNRLDSLENGKIELDIKVKELDVSLASLKSNLESLRKEFSLKLQELKGLVEKVPEENEKWLREVELRLRELDIKANKMDELMTRIYKILNHAQEISSRLNSSYADLIAIKANLKVLWKKVSELSQASQNGFNTSKELKDVVQTIKELLEEHKVRDHEWIIQKLRNLEQRISKLEEESRPSMVVLE